MSSSNEILPLAQLRRLPDVGAWGGLLLSFFILVILGGGQPLWGKIFLLAISGVCLIARPIERIPGGGRLWGAFLFLLLLIPFLPLACFRSGGFWLRCQSLGIELPFTLTPMPLLSFEYLVPYVGVVMLGLWSMELSLGHRMCKWGLWTLFLLISVLAIVTLYGNYIGLKGPYAPDVHCFSLFPNRNQSSILFTVGGLLGIGLATNGWGRNPEGSFGALILAMFNVLAMLASLSRGALFIAIIVGLFWFLYVGRSKGATFAIKLASPLVLFFFSLVLLRGNRIYERIISGPEEVAEGIGLLGLRWHIWRDCLTLIRDSWWTGIGPGMFRYVFPYYREHSLDATFIYHPENDWLWFIAEFGLPAGVLCLCLILLAFKSSLREWGSVQAKYRILACFSLLAVFLHSWVDVDLHSLAILLLCFLLLSFARPHSGNLALTAISRRWSRVVGIFLISISGLWTIGIWGDFPLHSSLIRRSLDRDLRDPFSVGKTYADYQQNIALIPLEKRFYFMRALAFLRESSPRIKEAEMDFKKVRFLDPISADLLHREARIWLSYERINALEAWSGIVGRYSQNMDRLFSEMAYEASRDSYIWNGLLPLAERLPKLRYEMTLRAKEDQFRNYFDEGLRAGVWGLIDAKSLYPLFDRRLAYPGLGAVETFLQEHPGKMNYLWGIKAKLWASRGAYERASQYVLELFKRKDPVLPKDERSTALIEHIYRALPENTVLGMELYQRYQKSGQTRKMLHVLRALRSDGSNIRTIWYLEAKHYFQEGNFRRSWDVILSAPIWGEAVMHLRED